MAIPLVIPVKVKYLRPSSNTYLYTRYVRVVSYKPNACTYLIAQANNYDAKYNANKTVLRKLSKWMIGLYGEMDEDNLLTCSYDVDNVLVVPILEQTHNKMEVRDKAMYLT